MDVGPGNPAARISTKRLPQEVRPLVSAINGALDRLTEAYQAEQRFVADAAHDLRTPLAVLSLNLQQAKLGGTTDWLTIEHDIEQLNKLLGQLLNLARKEHARQTEVASARPIIISHAWHARRPQRSFRSRTQRAGSSTWTCPTPSR